ncbi:MAG: hemerythrin domain-containing protein [Gemmatimonadota bacterium]
MESLDTPTALLRSEHRLILRTVGVLERVVAEWDGGEPPDLDAISDCAAFFRLFADACHHGKEEDLLFPELEARGIPREGGPIAAMLEEHRRGRAFVARMSAALEGARAGDGESLRELRDAAYGYIDLIRSHILKEDGVLFNMADGLLRGPACRELCAAYGVVCAGHFEGKTKQQLESLAADLARRYPPA